MAAAVVFLKRAPTIKLIQETTRPRAAVERVSSAQYLEFAPLRIEGGALPVVPALPWDMTASSNASPLRLSDGLGRWASVGLRDPGVRIAKAETAGSVERRVRRLSPSPEPPPGLLSGARLALESRAGRREIDRCAGRDLVPGGSVRPAAGKLVLRWVVRSDGSLGDLKVQEDSLHDARLSKCVVNAVRRWKFTPPTGGDAAVQSTFMFL
jgi:hypothetical protein